MIIPDFLFLIYYLCIIKNIFLGWYSSRIVVSKTYFFMKNSDNKLAVFRCDASTKIGSGHIMRCITLGNKLKSIGCNVIFICRAYDGNLIELTRKQFKVLILEKISFKHFEKNTRLSKFERNTSWPPSSFFLGPLFFLFAIAAPVRAFLFCFK